MIERVEMAKLLPQGLIKVELFDAETHEKVQEIETHNFIAKGVLEYIFTARAIDVFTTDRATNYFEDGRRYTDRFRMISLTDASHPEEPATEWLRRGTRLGYAFSTTTYSGEDPLQGSYNKAESFTTLEQVRMVFDWPTHAANGTFKSIYFSCDGNGAYTSMSSLAIPALEYLRSITLYKNRYYLLKGNTTLEIYGINWMIISKNTISRSQDMCIVDDFIYFINDVDTDTVKRAPITELTEAVAVVSIPGGGYMGGIAFDESTQEFITPSLQEPYHLRYIDKTFKETRRKPINKNSYSYSTSVLSLAGDGEVIIGSYHPASESHSYVVAGNTMVCGIIGDDVYTANYKYKKSFIGSRALLAEPITKTDKQVMKITYDFIMPKLY
ncbi:hypothetical protein LSPCS325_29200 [Lysinibacillus sp. CTST325]